jgi:hypothetical protein
VGRAPLRRPSGSTAPSTRARRLQEGWGTRACRVRSARRACGTRRPRRFAVAGLDGPRRARSVRHARGCHTSPLGPPRQWPPSRRPRPASWAALLDGGGVGLRSATGGTRTRVFHASGTARSCTGADIQRQRAKQRPRRRDASSPAHRHRDEGGPASVDRRSGDAHKTTPPVQPPLQFGGRRREVTRTSAPHHRPSVPAPTELQRLPEHAAPSPGRIRPGPRRSDGGQRTPAPSHAAPPAHPSRARGGSGDATSGESGPPSAS